MDVIQTQSTHGSTLEAKESTKNIMAIELDELK
jgi:hypothetical protein